MPVTGQRNMVAASSGGQVIVRGQGPLSDWAIDFELTGLAVSRPDHPDQQLPVGAANGHVATVTLVTTPVWPLWWLGWGPARWCDLALSDSSGRILAVLPAGGGWAETARISKRFVYPSYPAREHLPRLIPGWSRAEIEEGAAAAGVVVAERKNKSGRRIVLSLSDAYATWS